MSEPYYPQSVDEWDRQGWDGETMFIRRTSRAIDPDAPDAEPLSARAQQHIQKEESSDE